MTSFGKLIMFWVYICRFYSKPARPLHVIPRIVLIYVLSWFHGRQSSQIRRLTALVRLLSGGGGGALPHRWGKLWPSWRNCCLCLSRTLWLSSHTSVPAQPGGPSRERVSLRGVCLHYF